MIFTDPRVIDEEKTADEIGRAGRSLRIQFSKREACTPEILAQLNALCRTFGTKICVRFWGHYKAVFDFGILHQLPDVRSLIVDLRSAKNVSELGSVALLEELAIGGFEEDCEKLLELQNLARLRKLTLLPARKSRIDLVPLARFARLEELVLCGHAKNIDVLARLGNVKKLGLSGMHNSVRLEAVHWMSGLKSLWVVLGGRTSSEQFANSSLEQLRLDRIRGLERIDLSGFPRVSQLCIEDQSKFETLDLQPVSERLQTLQIFNMKNLTRLVGFECQTRLEKVWLGQTKIDPDGLLSRLPVCVRAIGFSGLGKRRDGVVKERVRTLGLQEAKYVGMLGM